MLSNLGSPRQTECRLSFKEDLPLRRREIEFLRSVQNGAPILLLREGPRHRQRAGHARVERNRLRAPPLRAFGWDVLLHPPDVRSEYPQERPTRARRSAGDLRRQRGDRTAAGDVIEVINVEVRIDQRLELIAASRLFNRLRETIPKLLQTLLEGLREQTLFALEMAIEPAVREAQVAHQLADSSLAPPTPESTGRCANDSPTGLLFVFGAVPHTLLPTTSDGAHHLIDHVNRVSPNCPLSPKDLTACGGERV